MADSIPVLHRARIFAQDRANREPRILFTSRSYIYQTAHFGLQH